METLRRLRTEKGLSQARLAARAELDPSTVNQIERGAREASPATLHKLAAALDVSLYELLEGEPRPKGIAPSPEPSFNDVLAGERRKPEYLREQLRIRGVEVSGSEAIVLAQYLEVHEHPPEDTYVIGHVKKKDEPVDNQRVAMLLTFVLTSNILTEDERVAAGGAAYQELVRT